MSTDEMNKSWEICLQRVAQFTAGGAALGFTLSFFFAKKRGALTFYGGGIGTGYTFQDCDKSFKELLSKMWPI